MNETYSHIKFGKYLNSEGMEGFVAFDLASNFVTIDPSQMIPLTLVQQLVGLVAE